MFNYLKSPHELMQFFKEYFKYGFVYRNKIYTDLQPDFQENVDKFYKIRLGEDFIKHKYGICWDFCECEREFFLKNNIQHECYFIDSMLNFEEGPTHTFALFKQNKKWYWFEFSWGIYRGIWEYNSKEEALQDILEKFEKFYNNKLTNIKLYKTEKVTKRLNAFKFVDHCLKGEKIELNGLEKN